MRLLYSGPSDENALTKRFEDADIAAALERGWRLQRRNPGEAEPEEPGSDAPNSKEAQIPRDADGKRLDGPTLEEWVAAGYKPEGYPTSDYAEKSSDGLTAFRQQQSDEAAAAEQKAADDATAAAQAASDAEAGKAAGQEPDSDDTASEQRPEDPEPPSKKQRRK